MSSERVAQLTTKYIATDEQPVVVHTSGLLFLALSAAGGHEAGQPKAALLLLALCAWLLLGSTGCVLRGSRHTAGEVWNSGTVCLHNSSLWLLHCLGGVIC